MENNSVVLKIEDYNYLRDFEKNIVNGKVFVYSSCFGWGGHSETKQYYTKNKVVTELANNNKSLEKEIDKLKVEIIELKNKKDLQPKTTIEDIKEMSLIQFLRWRRS